MRIAKRTRKERKKKIKRSVVSQYSITVRGVLPDGDMARHLFYRLFLTGTGRGDSTIEYIETSTLHALFGHSWYQSGEDEDREKGGGKKKKKNAPTNTGTQANKQRRGVGKSLDSPRGNLGMRERVHQL